MSGSLAMNASLTT